MKEKIKQFIRYHAIKKWYEEYERLLMPATLLFGVIVDWLTFTNINITSSFILLGIYFVIVGGTIIYLNAYDAGHIQSHTFFRYLRLASPLIIQFTFGALLSGSFIFYIFSGTVFVSWPFIVLLVILMVGNDVFHEYYLKPPIQVGVFFFILFSLVSIILPFAFQTISVWIFLVSGVMSLVFIALYVLLLSLAVPSMAYGRRPLYFIIAAIFVFMNGLYFFNIIPPIPLSLRDAAVAHDIDRAPGKYTLQVEPERFSDYFHSYPVFHKVAGETVYVYTAIFAPGKLTTKIVHHWQQYDETQEQWVTRDRLTFPITGGTKHGYRGYSVKTAVTPGRWRVDVETERGQTLGRVRFRIVNVEKMPELVTMVK